MNGSQIAQLVILIVLLCLSAFFSSAETAFTTVNTIYMRTLAQDGNPRAARVLQITENSGKMLSAILIGNNVVNLSASSLATTLAIGMFGSVGAGVATGIPIDSVGMTVFQGFEDNKFYILTHPEAAYGMVPRTQAILSGKHPT